MWRHDKNSESVQSSDDEDKENGIDANCGSCHVVGHCDFFIVGFGLLLDFVCVASILVVVFPLCRQAMSRSPLGP